MYHSLKLVLRYVNMQNPRCTYDAQTGGDVRTASSRRQSHSGATKGWSQLCCLSHILVMPFVQQTLWLLRRKRYIVCKHSAVKSFPQCLCCRRRSCQAHQPHALRIHRWQQPLHVIFCHTEFMFTGPAFVKCACTSCHAYHTHLHASSSTMQAA